MRVPRSHFVPDEPAIRRGDLVSSRLEARFGSYGNTVQVHPGDHGVVTSVGSDGEIECLFQGRLTWWVEDELEVLEAADDA